MMLKPRKDPTIVTQISRTKSIHLVGNTYNMYIHKSSLCLSLCFCAPQYNVAHFGCPFEFDLVYNNPEPTQGIIMWVLNYQL